MTNRRFDDYIEVNERIMAFYSKYPEGSLQTEIYTLTESLVVMQARAYRNPTDPRPATGWSSLQIPGSTNFTRGSEIENCETSAWGRAIAALGFEVKRGIASRQEVQNHDDPPPRKSAPKQDVADGELKNVGQLLTWATQKHGKTRAWVLDILGVGHQSEITDLADAKAALEIAIEGEA